MAGASKTGVSTSGRFEYDEDADADSRRDTSSSCRGVGGALGIDMGGAAAMLACANDSCEEDWGMGEVGRDVDRGSKGWVDNGAP